MSDSGHRRREGHRPRPPLPEERRREAARAAFHAALDVVRGRGPGARELFVVEGMRAVRGFLDRGAPLRVAFAAEAGGDVAAVLAALRSRGVPVHVIGRDEMERLARTKSPQGLLLLAERPRPDRARLFAPGGSFGVYLDEVQDPGNVGAIVRSAAALGASFVACGPGTADPFIPKAARAAAGAELSIPVVEDRDGSLPRELAEAGYRLLRAEPAEGASAATFAWPDRALLVLGSEGRGVSPVLRELGGDAVRIPITAGAGSLNVAQTAAILLWERRRVSRP